MANGGNFKTNYGYATTLSVATSPVDQSQSSIAMLKFDLTQVCSIIGLDFRCGACSAVTASASLHTKCYLPYCRTCPALPFGSVDPRRRVKRG